MEVRVDGEEKKNIEFRIGDIVLLSDEYYIIARESEGFILRKVSTWTGWNGHYINIDNLKKSLNNFVHYSKGDYELVITKKFK